MEGRFGKIKKMKKKDWQEVERQNKYSLVGMYVWIGLMLIGCAILILS